MTGPMTPWQECTFSGFDARKAHIYRRFHSALPPVRNASRGSSQRCITRRRIDTKRGSAGWLLDCDSSEERAGSGGRLGAKRP
jgi:hypothetical protein